MPDAPESPTGTAEVFQYALLRVVPSVPRGESLNVGVVLHCRRLGFLGVQTRVDERRLAVLDPNLDLDALRAHLQAIAHVATGDHSAGALSELDRSERFGWIVAPSSTLVQPSAVHTGLCPDPGRELARLAAELVRDPSPPHAR